MQPYFEATPGLLITEDDVRRLILRDRASHQIALAKPIRLSRVVLALLMIGLLTYIAINLPAYWIKSSFYVRHDLLPAQSSVTVPNLPPPVPGKVEAPAVIAPQIEDNHLTISRIEVSAPILWDVPDDTAILMRKLQNGVVHLKGNAHPGEPGNVFIVGHSSNLPWAAGNFKQVFALLPKVEIGDMITLTYHNTKFEYRVTEKKVIAPDDVSVLDNSGDARLTLMTCVPIGTNLKRQIVIAKPLHPVISNGALPTTSISPAKMLPETL